MCHGDEASLPDVWTCDQDERYGGCLAPNSPEDAALLAADARKKERRLVYTDTVDVAEVVGSIVWAKTHGYPRWHAPDPPHTAAARHHGPVQPPGRSAHHHSSGRCAGRVLRRPARVEPPYCTTPSPSAGWLLVRFFGFHKGKNSLA